MLTDAKIHHEYKGKKAVTQREFWMSPFRNQQGEFADRFEIIYTKTLVGKRKIKRSGHVTLRELAELFAHELLRDHGIRLRVRPIKGEYPDGHPGKKIPSSCIETGSSFDRMVRAIDTRAPITAGLRAELESLGVAA